MRYIVCVTNDCSSAIKTNNDEVIFISDKKDAKVGFNYYVEQYSCGDDKYEFVEFDEKHLKIVYNISYGEENPLIEENYLELFPLKSAKEL